MNTILTDRQIIQRVENSQPDDVQFIEGFVREKVWQGVKSYGLDPCGYTFRLLEAPQVTRMFGREYTELRAGDLHRYHSSYEYFNMPDDVIGFVSGKYSYEKLGVHLVPFTLEPGWSGNLELTLINHSTLPRTVWFNEGIGQVHFYELSQYPINTYIGDNNQC